MLLFVIMFFPRLYIHYVGQWILEGLKILQTFSYKLEITEIMKFIYDINKK